MMSPKSPSSDARSVASSSRQAPLQIIHVVGNFMRIWSVYSLYHYLAHHGDSVVAFIFSCLVPASVIFLVLQKPWKGRPLPNSQVIPTVINGGIMASYFVLWGKGLQSCGPLIALLAEYAGAVLGVLSAALYGRKVHIWRKVGGLFAMLASYYLLLKGWATRTNSPFYSFNKESLGQAKPALELKELVVPISAGILSALRRVIARRISLKNTTKNSNDFLSSHKRSVAELLHLVFSSPRHLMISGGGIIVMEILYQMDFSLMGFVICCSILGFGMLQSLSCYNILHFHTVFLKQLHLEDLEEVLWILSLDQKEHYKKIFRCLHFQADVISTAGVEVAGTAGVEPPNTAEMELADTAEVEVLSDTHSPPGTANDRVVAGEQTV
ncbi:hypothetical protein ZIOFF_023735 [Zingiber officinale]|uniref:Uncharacterized protein n=1 Tax=Zingiber officinale TaxID=94328 RepID=A0A8J5GZI8_ZINOF|nr:hypothetical protein ZIOFF_023735 [Zingiber officinale]